MPLLLALLSLASPPVTRVGLGADVLGGWGNDPSRAQEGDAALLSVAPWVVAEVRRATFTVLVDGAARVETSLPETLAPAAERAAARGRAVLAAGAPWLDVELSGWARRGHPVDPGAPPEEVRGEGGLVARLRTAGPSWLATASYALTAAWIDAPATPWGDTSSLEHVGALSAAWRFGLHEAVGLRSSLHATRPDALDPALGRTDTEGVQALVEAHVGLGGRWTGRFWAGWAGDTSGAPGTGTGGAVFTADVRRGQVSFGGGRERVVSTWGGHAIENFGELSTRIDSAGSALRVRLDLAARYAFVVHPEVEAPQSDGSRIVYRSHEVRSSERIVGEAALWFYVTRYLAVGVAARSDVRLSRFRIQSITPTVSQVLSAFDDDRFVDVTVLGGLRLELSGADW